MGVVVERDGDGNDVALEIARKAGGVSSRVGGGGVIVDNIEGVVILKCTGNDGEMRGGGKLLSK